MRLNLHPSIRVTQLTMGLERAPLVVIDNFVQEADELVSIATGLTYAPPARNFPGIRAVAPPAYQQLLIGRTSGMLMDIFGLRRGGIPKLSMCHYSVVTVSAHELNPAQRIPHVDSLGKDGLATIHYLFRKDWGGTAFYRHRRTGFEVVDESRGELYFKTLQSEMESPEFPGAGYINGDSALFERIAQQDGVFNRMLIYRRNSLHSGSIAENFEPDPNPRTGRLSINSFIDWA